jgi:hypothetical protein
MTPNERRMAREIQELRNDVEFLARRAGNFEKYSIEKDTPKQRSVGEHFQKMIEGHVVERRPYEDPSGPDLNELGRRRALGKCELSNGLTREALNLSHPVEFDDTSADLRTRRI